jgi:hypothetical protein
VVTEILSRLGKAPDAPDVTDSQVAPAAAV